MPELTSILILSLYRATLITLLKATHLFVHSAVLQFDYYYTLGTRLNRTQSVIQLKILFQSEFNGSLRM